MDETAEVLTAIANDVGEQLRLSVAPVARVRAWINKPAELRELERLTSQLNMLTQAIDLRALWLKTYTNVNQQELAQSLNRSQSSVSRMLREVAQTPAASKILENEVAPAATAMELVRRALRGEVPHEEFVCRLKEWKFDPPSPAASVLDEWKLVDNSTDAVLVAYHEDLLNDDEYAELVAAIAG